MKSKNISVKVGRKKGTYNHKGYAIIDSKGNIIDYIQGGSKRIYSRKSDASIRCAWEAGESVVPVAITFMSNKGRISKNK